MLTMARFEVFMLCKFEYINVLVEYERDLVARRQGEKMIDYKKLDKKTDQYYHFNKHTENDCLLEHVETVEKAKAFFYTYGSNLEQGVEIIRTEIKNWTDHWWFWDGIGFMLIAVALSARGSMGPIVSAFSIVAASRCLHQVSSILPALSACKTVSRDAEKIKNKVMIKGMTDQEIICLTNSFIDKHNRVWETQKVKEEIRERNNRRNQ